MEVYITYCGEQILVPKEVADFLDSDRKRMEALARQDRRRLSKSDFETALDSHHLTGRHDLEDLAIKNLSLQSLRKQIAVLSAEEQKLLSCRFDQDMTMEEIGEVFGVSKMAISKRRRKLFNKWSYEDVEVKDISLQDYIQIRQQVYLPHTAGRFAVKRFRKAQCPIVERLTNSLMMTGRNNGKKLMAARIVQHAFEIIHLLTDANPLQILVDAIINCGPREDSTRIGSQGTVRRQAVDVSPLRRVNQAISLVTIGTRESAFRNVKTVAECLADELINAAKGSANSYAIKKKDELERVAKSNR